MLIDEIKNFFKGLTNNQGVVELAIKIQQGAEKGNTAINSDELIDDKLISQNGLSGYLVQVNGLSGFRRMYNQEKFIQKDFEASSNIVVSQEKLQTAIQETCQLLKIQLPKKTDRQWQASLNFLRHGRYIVSGGPGTGKTTTVVRMLMMFQSLNPSARIALAAPTGKAANRMMQSMNDLLPEGQQQSAQTLHRLLGYNHQANALKYNQNNLLPYDLIIIDEASMLDVTLSNALIKALKSNAQLLLIGDKNQLPAVEAGNVFADLCELAKDNFTQLTVNYRFTADSIIQQLCNHLINQDIEGFHAINVYCNPIDKHEKLTLLTQWYDSIGEDSAVLLSPVKQGTNSVKELNELALRILYKGNKLNQGMPIIVNHNDYSLGVFNGDIGDLISIEGQWHVGFKSEGVKKYIKLEAIKKWQVAHAITIHKAQGSEYDHVLIALPNDLELELLTNALLYTAISRAKKTVTIWSNKRIIHKIIQTKEQRKTFITPL